jgi:hypothetical protein
MRSKTFKIVGWTLLIGSIFLIGYNMGVARGIGEGIAQEQKHCIKTVAENCEQICGVGRDAYFPDQHQGPDEDPAVEFEDSELMANLWGEYERQ